MAMVKWKIFSEPPLNNFTRRGMNTLARATCVVLTKLMGVEDGYVGTTMSTFHRGPRSFLSPTHPEAPPEWSACIKVQGKTTRHSCHLTKHSWHLTKH